MATASSSVTLGKKGMSGERKNGLITPSGTPDVSITINTSSGLTRGDFMNACKQIADHLSGYLK